MKSFIRNQNLFWGILFVLLVSGIRGFAQTEMKQDQVENPGILTIDRIFASREFSGERFGPARWLDDGKGYTTLERAAGENGGREIVRYDAKSGNREVLVSLEMLTPKGESKPLSIANYTWSSGHNFLLIFTNTKRVWRQNTRGDYWVLNLKTKELHKLGGDAGPSSLMFAKFSPDEMKVGYVHDNNIFVEDLGDHYIRQLTWDGSKTIINGNFDWVYEEEFRIQDGFRWSPDSRSIAYWQLDASKVGIFYLINDTDSIYSKVIPIQYPKVGTSNSACRIGVVDAGGSETVWMNVPGIPSENYIPRMDWADNSTELIIQRLNRRQNTNHVMFCNAKTGEVRTVFTDRDSAWVDVVNDLQWLEKGQKFTWLSERDGWRHVYLISRNGNAQLVTPGDYDVVSIERIDEKGGWLYFIGSLENPTQRYLYRIKLNGKGKPELLSPADQEGTHGYDISPDSKWAFHTFSSADEPSTIDLVQLPRHKVARTLVKNEKLRAKVNALNRMPTEFFQVDVSNGLILYGWQIKPLDFDPAKKYPVFFYVYGEPWGQTVADRWGGSTYLWHLMLAQKGYVVMSIDNRGTPMPRGREWRKVVYKKIGVIASADQAAALRKILEWDYVDSTRVGIWGWSGGGSMTLNMMLRYPNFYKTGMAVASVPDIRLYDTIYQERYMGLLEDNPEAYKQSSPITFADQLKGNLLIVHGTGDDNVHYQGAEKLINELIKDNKQFTMLAYPNRTHGIFEGQNTTRHLRILLTDYLLQHLPAGGK